MADAYLFRTYAFSLRLNASERRRMDLELTRQRRLYNDAHQERQDSYRWACRQASVLGLARPKRSDVQSIDPYSLDPIRRSAYDALVEWRSPDYISQSTVLTLKRQTVSGDLPFHDAAIVATRWTLARLEDAWKAFFSRCASGQNPGFPRFRSEVLWKSWGCSEIADGAFLRTVGNGLGFRILGFLKVPTIDKPLAVRLHRTLPLEAKVVSCTFTRRGKRWEVGLQCRLPLTHGCETDEDLSDIVEDDVLGFDAGILTQAMDDHGNAYENERHGQRLAKMTRRAQRCAQRAKRGSKNSRKKKARIAGLRRKEANARSTSSRQNAARLVNEALATNMRVIAHEDLKIRNMMRSAAGTAAEPGIRVAQKRGLNRALADAALGRFAKDVRSKAERAGLRCVAVDPRRTSQECWSCGTLVPKALGQRVHDCPRCGFVADRDVNAAMVIRKRAVTRLRMTIGTEKEKIRSQGRRGGRASRDREAPIGARSKRLAA